MALQRAPWVVDTLAGLEGQAPGLVILTTPREPLRATSSPRPSGALGGRSSVKSCSRSSGSVHEHRKWPRHPKGLDWLRSQFCADWVRQEIQSPRHNWCCHYSLSKKDACRTLRGVYVLARWSFGLPTWCFWYGTQRTQGFGADALSSAGILFTCKVRYWHLADMGRCTAHVRFWG